MTGIGAARYDIRIMKMQTGPAARRAAAGILAALLAALPTDQPVRAQEAAPVVVDAVAREPLSQTVEVIGRLVARRRVVVAARTAGPVAEMPVQVGDRVAEGDVLAVIESDRLSWRRDLARADLAESEASLANARAGLASAKARLTAAEARLALARQELARLERLRKSAAFSQARYDDKTQEAAAARSDVEAAHADIAEAASRIDQSKAQIQRARANLRLAEDDLDHATVRAPFAGVITQRHTEIGAYLEVGAGVVALLNDTEMEIEADVPFTRLAGLAPGAEVAFRLDDGRPRVALVRALGVEENPSTRTRRVRFTPRFEGETGPLADGQSVTLALPLGPSRMVTTVHKDAVVHGEGGAIVFVVGNGVAERRPVTLGTAIGDRLEVTSGLEPGELVVVRGNERLIPGQPVTFGGGS